MRIASQDKPHSKKKTVIQNNTEHTTKANKYDTDKLNNKICQMHDCNREAVQICKYCNRAFCEKHIVPKLVISPHEIWDINNSKELDPEKYSKYIEDWNSEGGHPCPEYTKLWNTKHNEEREKRSEWIKRPINFGKLREYASTVETPYRKKEKLYFEENKQIASITNSQAHYSIRSNSSKIARKLAIILTILIVISLFFYMNFLGLLINPFFTKNMSNIRNISNNMGVQYNLTSSTTSVIPYIPLSTLLKNISSYLNKTLITSGLLIKTNGSAVVPGAYFLIDNDQNRGIEVLLPPDTVFHNVTNYTITGVVMLYNFPPAPWNGYTDIYKVYYINSTKAEATKTYNIANNNINQITECVNLNLRIRVADYLNNSEVQQLLNYCQYYEYNPPNKTYTAVCTYIKYCTEQLP
ncbi:MAG: hypothetical protein ACP5U0_10220 [Caldisphaera sp.]